MPTIVSSLTANRYLGDRTAGLAVDQATGMNECIGVSRTGSKEQAACKRNKCFHILDSSD